MSTSPEFVDKAVVGGGRTSFSQKCSLLSQYLKEKGGFGDLSLGMTCNVTDRTGDETPEVSRQPATTMNLFPVAEKPSDVFNRNIGTPRSTDLFTRQAVGFASPASKEDVHKGLDSSVTNKSATVEPQTAQMTIFYAGQVIVFDNFPADKAKEVMMLASKGCSQTQTAIPTIPAKNHSLFAHNVPQTRKASLHRFLEKRKDRITARAPYQPSSPSAAPSKPGENKLWLGLAAQSPQ